MASEKAAAAYNPYRTGSAPPAYTEIAGPSGSSIRVDMSTGMCEDEMAAPPSGEDAIKAIYGGISGINILSECDTILVLDDSESMSQFGYWNLLGRCISHIGPVITAFDQDGVSLYFLNTRGPCKEDLQTGVAKFGWTGLKDGNSIDDIFKRVKPMGTTPIDERLAAIVAPYLALLTSDSTKRPRPINILVVTDGVPNDEEGVEELIQEICETLDECNAPDSQIGLQFVQIADLVYAEQYIRQNAPSQKVNQLIQKARDDLEASQAWLQKLDDFLQRNNQKVTRDIVDTKNAREMSREGYGPKSMVSLLVGGMSRRHDHKSS